jgi:hypothetical protein
MLLELQAALRVEQEILGETSPILSEALVERVVPNGLKPVTDGGNKIIKVSFVFLIVETTPGLSKLVRVIVAPIF